MREVRKNAAGDVEVLCLGLRIVDDDVRDGDASRSIGCETTALEVENLPRGGGLRASMQLIDVVMCPTCRLQGTHSSLFRIVHRDPDVRFDPSGAAVSVGCVKSFAAIEEDQRLEMGAEARTNRCLAIVSELVASCQPPSAAPDGGGACCADVDEFIALECNCDPFTRADMQPFSAALLEMTRACDSS